MDAVAAVGDGAGGDGGDDDLPRLLTCCSDRNWC